MKRASRALGEGLFWLLWPAFWLYLRNSTRARVLIVQNNKVLVVSSWLGDGRWALPGGGIHKEEAPEVAACREVQEELGIILKPAALKDLGQKEWRDKGLHYYIQLFQAVAPREFMIKTQRLEISSWAWYPPSELSLSNAAPELLWAVKIAQAANLLQ